MDIDTRTNDSLGVPSTNCSPDPPAKMAKLLFSILRGQLYCEIHY